MPAPSRSPRRLSIQRVYRQSFSHIAARRQLPLNSTHGLPVQAIRKNENQSNNQQPRWNSAIYQAHIRNGGRRIARRAKRGPMRQLPENSQQAAGKQQGAPRGDLFAEIHNTEIDAFAT